MITLPADISAIIAYRPMEAEDRSYVIRTWVAEYRESDVGRALGPVYSQTWGQVVERILETMALGAPEPLFGDIINKGNTHVTIACLSAEPGSIVGFVCWSRVNDRPVLHFVYVKHKWRGFGIGGDLVAPVVDSPIVGFTHMPSVLTESRSHWIYTSPLSPSTVRFEPKVVDRH